MMQAEKKQLVEICCEIAQKRMVVSSGGNVSIRVGDSVLITPSGLPFSQVKPRDIVELGPDGEKTAGGTPSKETPFHLAIYQELPEVKAVIHTHSFFSVCVSIMEHSGDWHNIIPAYTPGFVIKAGKVPLIPFKTPGSAELARAITATFLAQKVNAVLLQNHGLVVLGHSLRDALNVTEEIEENARLHIVLKGQGRKLSAGEIRDIEDGYNCRS